MHSPRVVDKCALGHDRTTEQNQPKKDVQRENGDRKEGNQSRKEQTRRTNEWEGWKRKHQSQLCTSCSKSLIRNEWNDRRRERTSRTASCSKAHLIFCALGGGGAQTHVLPTLRYTTRKTHCIAQLRFL